MVSSRKSLHESDPGKGVNLHIFKMAANETNNVGYYWLCMVDFIPYKCISNKQDNGVFESSEYNYLHPPMTSGDVTMAYMTS